MTIGSQNDIEGLKEIGRIVALTIKEMKNQARAGMTTKELDEIGGQILGRYGAVSAPKITYDFLEIPVLVLTTKWLMEYQVTELFSQAI